MQVESPRLTSAALSIVDGSDADWDQVLEGAASAQERDTLLKLRDIARIAASSLPDDVPCTRWGSIELIEPIGRGNHGEVYLGWDARLARQVAVKLLHHPDNALATARLLREARLLARIKHPNVLTIHGADQVDGRAGMWMELVRGRTLEDELRTRGPLPLAEVMQIGASLASALQAVHDAGVVHRDVKATNVMREPSGRIVLMDFGVGDVLSGAGRPGLTGTPLYLAPEVFENSAPGPRTDIYALGVLLYHVATGRYPVEARTVDALRSAHRAGTTAVDLREIRPPLRAVLRRALAHDPEERYATAAEMAGPLAAPPTSIWAQTRRPALGLGITTLMVAVGYLGWTAAGRSGAAMTWQQLPVEWSPRVQLGRPLGEGHRLICSDDVGRLAVCDPWTSETTPVLADDPGGVGGSFTVASSDGTQIAYLRNVGPSANRRAELRVVGADGTGDRGLYRASAVEGSIRPGAFSPDGRSLIGLRRDVPEGRTDYETAIVRLDAHTGRLLDEWPVSGGSVVGFAVTADATLVAFDVGEPDRNIVVRNLETHEQHILGTASADEASPIWAPNGEHLLYISDEGGTRALYAQAFSAGRPAGSARVQNDFGRSRVTPLGFTNAGREFLYVRQEGGREVRLVRLNGEGAVAGDSERVSSRILGQSTSPLWSPAGDRLAYVEKSGASGSSGDDLHVVILDVEDRRDTLVPVPGSFEQARLRRWSGNGRWLAYDWFEPGQGGRQAIIDTREARLVPNPTGNEFDDTAGFVGRGSGGTQLVHLAPDGAITPLFDLPGEASFQRPLAISRSRTARRTAFGAEDAATGLRRVYVVNEVTRQWFELPSTSLDVRPLDWYQDGSTLFVARMVRADPPAYDLERIDGTTGRSTVVMTVEEAILLNVSVHPRGESLAYAVDLRVRPTLWAASAFRIR